MKRPELRLHCTCGASIYLQFRHGTTPAQMQRAARAAFLNDHTGDGHQLCDARTTSRVRSLSDQGSKKGQLL